MKKNSKEGAVPEDVVQPEDPILESLNVDNDEMEAVAEDKSAEDEIELIKQQLADKEKEIEETNQKYLRLAAEYDNFRRRSQKEKEAIYNDSITQVVKEWLPVLDSLDRAAQLFEQSGEDESAKFSDGLALVRKQACDVMSKLGVSEIDCLNQPFDPNLHDAVMHVEDDDHGPSTVVEELQKGYQRGESVIRHSIVKVAN